jgi:hypothetical protein
MVSWLRLASGIWRVSKLAALCCRGEAQPATGVLFRSPVGGFHNCSVTRSDNCPAVDTLTTNEVRLRRVVVWVAAALVLAFVLLCLPV